MTSASKGLIAEPEKKYHFGVTDDPYGMLKSVGGSGTSKQIQGIFLISPLQRLIISSIRKRCTFAGNQSPKHNTDADPCYLLFLDLAP